MRSIVLKGWNPDTPYLTQLKECKDMDSACVLSASVAFSRLLRSYLCYIALRGDYRNSPSYYFDVSSFCFERAKQAESKSPADAKRWLQLGARVLMTRAHLPLLLRQLTVELLIDSSGAGA